jgi:RNA polymerase sigma-70 factor (ECF subfamily)
MNMVARLPLDRPTASPEDRDLVAAVLRRDRKATARLVDLHADALYAYVHQRLLPRADLVEDLVQEVFLAAWSNLAAFRGESSLRAWLLGIARHKVEDFYRSRLSHAEALPEEEAEPASPPQLDDALDRERRHEKTRRVLRSLPEPYSLVLLWRYWEKRSARDIAALTGRTEKAVERLLARAREQFKRRWNDG